MSISCLKCNKPSVIFIRYNGTHLCKKHFFEYFEKRVKKEIKKQGKTNPDSHIGIAVSGGKDSIVTLYMLNEIFSKRSQIYLYVITVDEGIKGYRDHSIAITKKTCKQLSIPHYIISFKEIFGKTMDEIALLNSELGECSYCGVFRRFCLNMKTKELGITKLATGHNLDDMSQSILMNFINGDLQKLARLGPHQKIQPGLVPRIMPLRSIPEKEIMLYALLKNMQFHNAECPYAVHASRRQYRDIIDALEYKNPGTRHSILNSYDNLKSYLIDKYPPVSLNCCKTCGEPTSQQICKACILKQKIS
ncbi:MAG: TIGR00269 family protein [Thermoplasmatota archaeon]